MLIPTYYLLSKNWDIFATSFRISLIINTDYFRGGEVRSYYILEIVQPVWSCTIFLFLNQPILHVLGGALALEIELDVV